MASPSKKQRISQQFSEDTTPSTSKQSKICRTGEFNAVRMQHLSFHEDYMIDTKKFKWSLYFKYIGHSEKSIVWECLQCKSSISIAQGYGNAHRHYETVHNIRTSIVALGSQYGDSTGQTEELSFQEGYTIDTMKFKWSHYFKYLGHSAKSIVWECLQCNNRISVAKNGYGNAHRHYETVHNIKTSTSTQGILQNNSSTQPEKLTFQEDYTIDTVKFQWSLYFKYIGHSAKSIVWECLECNKMVSVSKTGYGNARRHYEFSHKPKIKKETLTSESSQTGTVNPDVLDKPKTKQEAFDEIILELIAEHGMYTLVDHPKFEKLVKVLDHEVKVNSCQYYIEKLQTEVNEKVVGAIEDMHQDMEEDYLNYSIDTWGSKQGNRVASTRVHFIDEDWNLQNHLIGFEEYSQSCSSSGIGERFETLLTSLGSEMSKTNYIVINNAENMLSALNMEDIFEDGLVNNRLEENVENNDESQFDMMDEDGTNEKFSTSYEIEDYLKFLASEGEDGVREEKNQSTNQLSCQPCLAHTFQLVINNAIKEDPEAMKFVIYIEQLLCYFRKRSNWTSDLGKLCSNLEIVTPSKTRWHSLYFTLDRLTQETMLAEIDEILKRIRLTDKSLTKILLRPKKFNTSNVKKLFSLLKPIQEASDRLQTEPVSISSAIITILGTFETVSLVSADLFSVMKTAILKGMQNRFENVIINSDVYILSSFLDPRVKDSVFNENWSDDSKFELKLRVPNFCRVESLIASEFEELKKKGVFTDSNKGIEPSHSGNTEKQFNFSSVQRPTKNEKNEWQMYIDEVLQNTFDPLDYWRTHSQRYPNLAWLARKFLSIPATSAGVDKVISIAGFLHRARRGGMTPENSKNIVLYREYLC